MEARKRMLVVFCSRNAAIYEGKLRAFIASLGIESASAAGRGNARAHA